MKILVAIASYGTRNDHFLSQLVREYKSMSHEVDIVVLSNAPKEVAAAEVSVIDMTSIDPWSLPFPHKQMFAERLNDYDLFIYSEDDTLIQEKNIAAFLSVSADLPASEIPGFLRFERDAGDALNFPEIHGHFHWDPASLRTRGTHTLAFFTNEHAACYVLTRDQLRRAIESGGFLVGPHQGKYDLLCTAATDPYTQCGFQKLICISRLDDFLIHHLPNKYVGTTFGVSEIELRRQIAALQQIGGNGRAPESLFQTETKLPHAWYSKCYYEEIQPRLAEAIPAKARTVLSVGCGSGIAEGWLAENGRRVTAVPLDGVIAGTAEAKGVEIVSGSFVETREKLAGRKFDCILLSNVLHLVPDPVGVLTSYSALLAEDGASIALIPNTSHLALLWKQWGGKFSFRAHSDFETTSVHRTSHRVIRRWFQGAGMRIAGITNVLGPRAKELDRATSSAFDRLLATEFVVEASKTCNA